MSKLNFGIKACGAFLLWAAGSAVLSAQAFTTLHSFNGTDGENPFAGVIQATDENVYGTTPYGGSNSSGTLFKITTVGTLTTLYNFCAQTSCVDGSQPYGGLLQGADGNLYGTTSSGGTGSPGGGTIFKLTLGGELTTIYNFCSLKRCTDGMTPSGALIQDSEGNFYGTTVEGGSADLTLCMLGCGTTFEIKAGGGLKMTHEFRGGDGAFPWAGLVQGANGSFYGTTLFGGQIDTCEEGCGTIFGMASGKAIQYAFCSQVTNGLCTDGGGPLAGLVLGRDRNLYGVTEAGGAHGGGMFFKITPDGVLTRLYSFCPSAKSGMCPDGDEPEGTLIQGADGNFYGTTFYGGNYACQFGCGTIFKIAPGGTLTTLHLFDGTDGSNPQSALFQGADGNFCGTTSKGGTNDDGTVFSLSVGLK